MALALLLAGPILRRVEPTLVCVWVALSQAASLKLTVWEGRVAAGADNPLIASEPGDTQMLRVGERLFVAVVALKIDKTTPKVLLPGRMYSYDLAITVGAGTQDLEGLGLLRSGVVNGKRVEALGFGDDEPPNFSLPPAELPLYRLSSLVPAHWIPLLPVQLQGPGGSVQARLKRGAVLLPGGSQQLRHALGLVLGHGTPGLLHDEEVPREGVRVTRHYQLARWVDGATFAWIGRHKAVGRGEGSSGLRFDRIESAPSDQARP